jgi:4,5-dihydroxyphthalate decarboxylase
LKLLVGVGRYDRTAPLLEGRIGIEGVDARFESPPLEQLFARAFDKGDLDVAELSFSNYVYLTSEKKCNYVALPIFPSRTFRHAAIYVRTDAGIRTPRELIGRVVGVREFSMTAALMARGVLEDDFGVKASSIKWRYGRADADDALPIARMKPRDTELESIADNQNLSDLLVAGKIDALIAYTPPKCFVDGAPNVRRLFPDHVAAERDYYARTGVFPIMHVVAIRRDHLANAKLCTAVCNAFEQAKRLAFAALEGYASLSVALPWAFANLAEARAVMGPDFWPYGVAKNSAAIEAVARYSEAQGLAKRVLPIGEIFVESTLEWSPLAVPAPVFSAH